MTIITVSFNSAKTISKTIESVLNQTYTDFEYLIIDGDSTDSTVDIIKQYMGKFEKRGIQFRWISEADTGIYNAMNKGISQARGKYIGILNSDDTYELNALQIVSSQILLHPEVQVFHGLMRYLSNGELTMVHGRSSNRLNIGMIEHPTCFVAKQTYQTFGAFDEKYRFVADYDLLLRLKRNGCKFLLIEEILANFDENGAGNSYQSRVELLELKRRYGLSNGVKILYQRVKILINELQRKE
ncbi:hypothetical protein FD01_GL001958 [Lacticaseibacillus manihotivorans DSM 13343 = JCM 12514]|uniref:Glycosyltransferase 2-like domain-containing protein n=2 Tax=Lacticaseibacillus manihotivorans TaxID=88233 RepID=A0A0R1QBY2_9LACO|nr:hypothetical protein FD01_GL001958 [Lacticaseibacillus manihotivorans DSM 13343 = JCM 12514]